MIYLYLLLVRELTNYNIVLNTFYTVLNTILPKTDYRTDLNFQLYLQRFGEFSARIPL